MKRFFEVQLQSQGGPKVLVAATEGDDEWLQRQPPGRHIKADVKRVRSVEYHRKAFALINLIYDNQREDAAGNVRWASLDDCLVELKLKLGWYREHVRTQADPKAVLLLRLARELPDSALARRIERGAEMIADESMVIYVPKSIAFENMDQDQFEAFYNALVEIAIRDYGLEHAREFVHA